jgi:hypothetical protein
MNKKLVLAAGLMTLMAGFVEANEPATAVEANVVFSDEASFMAKLNKDHSIAFNLMDAEDRQEIVAEAQKENYTPDAAVESFMDFHHLALVDGELKTVEVK